jgi:hypothetical protein
MMGYTCRTCGELHTELPLAYGVDAPVYWYGMPAAERAQRFVATPDIAIMDHAQYFIRGNLEIPLEGSASPFTWGVWVTMGRVAYEDVVNHWETPGREYILESSTGYLSTVLPGYPDTLNLHAWVHHQALGVRPLVELEVTAHPLSVEQQRGIDRARLEEIAALVLHDSARGDA